MSNDQVYGYEQCPECNVRPDNIKLIGLEVGEVNYKMYYECTECDFLQVGWYVWVYKSNVCKL